MNISLINNADVSYLDELLLEKDGFLKLLPASAYSDINPEHLMIWAVKNARYGFPTIELIDWLKEQIKDQFAIELAAGKGDLGRHLGIMQTDSYMQLIPEVTAFYALTRQPIIEPPESVYKYDANQAINCFKPDIAIASWLTQRFRQGDPEDVKASVYGAEEFEIIDKVKVYIHIGNENVHGTKRILCFPHETYRFPWLVSRAEDPAKNLIYVWRKQ
jgi:hypothetical protein